MSKHDDGGPAFPWGGDVVGGMTLRDYFAAKAMHEHYRKADEWDDEWIRVAAAKAYRMADAMLAARGEHDES